MGKYSAIWGNIIITKKKKIIKTKESQKKKWKNSPESKNSEAISEDRNNPDYFFITVLVKANARQNRIFMEDKKLYLDINAPPIKGKANSSIIKLLSKTLNIPKSEISLIKGQTSHQKTFYIHIEHLNVSQIYEKLTNY